MSSSLSKGLVHKKLLLADGIDDEDENSFLYVEVLELTLRGETCGEL